MLAVLLFASCYAAPTVVPNRPTNEDMQNMASNYWVRQVGPSDDISVGLRPASLSGPDPTKCKAAMGRFCSSAPKGNACYSCLHEHTAELYPCCHGTASGQTFCGDFWQRLPSKSATPTNAEMKNMASNYWVRQVGPSDNIASEPRVASKPRMSFAGTPRGMLTAEQYLEGGKQMAKFGYAKAFGNDTAGALAFVNSLSGWSFKSWAAVEACGRSPQCHAAFQSDPELIGHNATLASVQAVLPGEETVRCHNHAGGGIWCHENVSEFNEGSFYVIEVVPDDTPTLVRNGLVMCHEWPKEYAKLFEERDGTRCHTMPVGLVLTKKASFCARHDCRAAWTTAFFE